MESYKIHKVIGDGSFGVVSKATNVKTGEIVAIKKIKKKFATWDECMSLRELKSLRKLNHPNIIKLKEAIKVADELYFVFEFLDQNIFQLYNTQRESGKSFTENQIRSIIYQTALGLAYMHKHGFFHRDLKPENLMIHKDYVKIADFGLAREIRSRPPFTDYVATRWYRAPEILLKSTTYNSPVDVFALGCIMAELYTFSPLFKGNSEMDQLYKICSILGTPTQLNWSEGYRLATQMGFNFPQFPAVPLQTIITNASDEAIQLISEMIKYDAHKRPSAQQVLQHPYFMGYVHIERPMTPQIDESSPVLQGKSRDGSPMRPARKEDRGRAINPVDSTLGGGGYDNNKKELNKSPSPDASFGKYQKEKSSGESNLLFLKRPDNAYASKDASIEAPDRKDKIMDEVVMSTKLLEEEINQALESYKNDFSPKPDKAEASQKKNGGSINNMGTFGLHPSVNSITMDGLTNQPKLFLPIMGGPSKIQAGQMKLIQNPSDAGYVPRFGLQNDKSTAKNLGQLGPSPYDFLPKNTTNIPSNTGVYVPRLSNQSPSPFGSPVEPTNIPTNVNQSPILNPGLPGNNLDTFQTGAGSNYPSPGFTNNSVNKGPQIVNTKYSSINSYGLKPPSVNAFNSNTYGSNTRGSDLGSNLTGGFDFESVLQEEVGGLGRYKF